MISKIMKRSTSVFIAVLMALSTGCSASPEADVKLRSEDEMLSDTVLPDDKMPITVLMKNAFTINTFEKAAEEFFPNIDIIQVRNHTADMGIEEYKTRLKNNDLTDIVMTWPLDVGNEYWADNLMELSSLPLTSKYTTSILDSIAQDGKLYYLPGPAQIRGIVYNKTLFEENGWGVPKDFEGFIKLCHDIESTGIRSLQLGLQNEEVLDTAFVGYGYESSFSTPENAQNMEDYNNGKGSFADNFSPALDTFKRLVDEGILKKEDLDIDYAEREEIFFTRKCAMIEDSMLLTHKSFVYNGCTDEFAIMPFLNPPSDKEQGFYDDWARLYYVCYVGANKELSKPENKEKYDAVMEILEYISTPEGQAALAGDTGGMFSSLNGAAPPDVSEINDLVPALTHGRCAVFPTLKNAQNALRKGLAGMVSGELTKEDVIKMVDAQNAAPVLLKPPAVIGTAAENFSLIETGSFITDAMRKEVGSDMALFLDNGKNGKYNGKGVSAKLYKGDLTALDIKRILPDLKYGEKGELWKVTMTGEDLIKTLEYAIPVENNRRGWFYYFSGLRMEFAPSATPGERIKSITDDKGEKIDPKKLYSIAVMDESVPAEFIQSCEKTGVLISSVLEKTIKSESEISPKNDERFTVLIK